MELKTDSKEIFVFEVAFSHIQNQWNQERLWITRYTVNSVNKTVHFDHRNFERDLSLVLSQEDPQLPSVIGCFGEVVMTDEFTKFREELGERSR